MPQDNLDNPGANAPKASPANRQGNEAMNQQAQQEFESAFGKAKAEPAGTPPDGAGAPADGNTSNHKIETVTGDSVSVTQAEKVFQYVINFNSDTTSPASLVGALDTIGSMLDAMGDSGAETKAMLEKLKTTFKHPSLPGASLVKPREHQSKAGETPSSETDEEPDRTEGNEHFDFCQFVSPGV